MGGRQSFDLSTEHPVIIAGKLLPPPTRPPAVAIAWLPPLSPSSSRVHRRCRVARQQKAAGRRRCVAVNDVHHGRVATDAVGIRHC